MLSVSGGPVFLNLQFGALWLDSAYPTGTELSLYNSFGQQRTRIAADNDSSIRLGNGRLGIGTIRPGAKLHVAGDEIVDGDVYSRGLKLGVGSPGPAGPAGQSGKQGVAGPAGPQGPQGIGGATGQQGRAGPVGPAGAVGVTSMTTVAQNYSDPVNLSCPSGYYAVVASCNAGVNLTINGQTPAPPGGTWASYLIPNVTAATAVHCSLGAPGLQSQALLRCAK